MTTSFTIDQGAVIISRLRAMRRAMAEHGLAAWIALTGDPHLCEYQPEHWAFRKYLSGFTGSAGTLAVTTTSAALWTDSRYWEQAAQQLAPAGIDLMQDGAIDTPSITTALAAELDAGARVGLDPRTVSAKRFAALKKEFAAAGITLVCDMTLMDEVWADRPQAVFHPVRTFGFGQKPVAEKLSGLRREIARAGAQALLISTLDDIAWLTNLRGADLECTPVFTAYAAVSGSRAVLFADTSKITGESLAQIASAGFDVIDYADALTEIPHVLEGQCVLLDPDRTSQALFEILEKAGISVVAHPQPTQVMKSRRTHEELELLKETMRRDGAAMCELFAWLEREIHEEKTVTELDVSHKLRALRSEIPGFMGLSFETIAAAGANAALPHYQPTPENNAVLSRGEMLLIDSGGQYEGGTTDITRTILVGGEASAAQKRDFTAVLRGHILLATTHFPRGTFASQLDTLARMPIWEIGCDFGHGTGHGVGFCLNVHEGPISISPRCPANAATRIVEGLVFSNEPGLYRPGRWGVRTENLVTPVAADPEIDQMMPMLVLETLTLCPIDFKLINTAMMSPYEIWWVNDYHRKVREALMPLLSVQAQEWLKRATETI